MPEALAAEGVKVVIVARGEAPLAEAASDIRRRFGVNVTRSCVTSRRKGVPLALAACPQPDILVTNAGGPPAGDFKESLPSGLASRHRCQRTDAVELIKATIDGMINRATPSRETVSDRSHMSTTSEKRTRHPFQVNFAARSFMHYGWHPELQSLEGSTGIAVRHLRLDYLMYAK